MFNVIALVLCVLSSLFLIVFILLHSGKGSGLSDMFGGTSSLSGGTALERRLDKITVVTALIFFGCRRSGCRGSGAADRSGRARLLESPDSRRSGGTW